MVSARRRAERALEAWLEDLVSREVVPGGHAVVVREDRVLFDRPFGRVTRERDAAAVPAEAYWDLASLTKPLVTASLCLLLRRRGELDFRAPVGELVPELLEGARFRAPTVGELLLHAAGLPAWEPLYALVPGGALADRARWLATRRGRPGSEVLYGCPGYQVLGLVVARAAGRPLPELAESLLWPGRDDVAFPLPEDLRSRAMPTEVGNAHEARMARERGSAWPGFRTGLIRGETHDHNAFTLGGAAGNAGLFATAGGTTTLVRRFLAPGDGYTAADLAELATDMTPEAARAAGGEPRSWGVQLAASADSPADGRVAARAYGHSGFTGTSFVIDPDRRAAHVLLTNRIHPRWTPHPFNGERRAFHALATALVEATRGD